METQTSNRFTQLEVLFRKYSERIFSYIRARINSREDAENLSQDVWMKIMESNVELSTETASSYIYRVAANLINDYLRNLYVKMGAQEEILNSCTSVSNVTPEDDLCVKQIAALEWKKIECLPRQRRIIYTMSRFEDKSVGDIASKLSLSFRTVENHLRMGRRDVREFLTAIA